VIRPMLHTVFGVHGWEELFVRIVTIAFLGTAIIHLLPPSIYPRRNTRRGWIAAVAVAAAAAILVWDISVYLKVEAAAEPHADKLLMTPISSGKEALIIGSDGELRTSPDTYLGVYEPGEMGSYQPIDDFTSRVGRAPNIVLYYSSITVPFQEIFADRALANGAVPLVQLNPGRASMEDIATGREDRYLRSFAREVQSFGHPVIIGFASEPDGNSYSWGYTHTSPPEWIAAWRHVVTLFRHVGAGNVTWLWTINAESSSSTGQLHDWWPGGQYVTWIGIDGYYYRSNASFTSVFGSTIRDIRSFTNAPILLSETAIGPVAGPSKIAGLFAGVEADHLLGFVWYDQAQHDGIYHQDWRLEDNPMALAAFRSAVKGYR
jgi:Glycosyl hydrolase family 26